MPRYRWTAAPLEGVDSKRAVALGATGVLLGQPWAFELAARGEAGVATMFDPLRCRDGGGDGADRPDRYRQAFARHPAASQPTSARTATAIAAFRLEPGPPTNKTTRRGIKMAGQSNEVRKPGCAGPAISSRLIPARGRPRGRSSSASPCLALVVRPIMRPSA